MKQFIALISISIGCGPVSHFDYAPRPYTVTETSTCDERSPKDEMLKWNGTRWVNVVPKCKTMIAVINENSNDK